MTYIASQHSTVNMCIFTDDVNVANTKIFVAAVNKEHQLTVYSNTVRIDNDDDDAPYSSYSSPSVWGDGTPRILTGNIHFSSPSPSPSPQIVPKKISRGDLKKGPAAMVLPIPVRNSREASSIQMVDMSSHPDFFEKLREATVQPNNSLNSRSSISSNDCDDELEVKRCGPYSYSIVPDVESFSKLRTDLYGKGVSKISIKLKNHYGGRYAFLVCIIDSSATFSPVAYLHPLASDGEVIQLFVPTMHDHDGGAATVEKVGGSPPDRFSQMANDWDHAIYSIDKSFGIGIKGSNKSIKCKVERAVKKPEFTKRFPYVLDWTRLGVRHINGVHPNGDIELLGVL